MAPSLSQQIQSSSPAPITAPMADQFQIQQSLSQTLHPSNSGISVFAILQPVGERNRGIYILKSRGMNHSNQVREFLLSDHGVEICDVYIGAGGVATGGARLNMLAQEKALGLKLQEEIELRQFDLENKRNVLDSRIAAMRAEFAAQEASNLKMIAQEKTRRTQVSADRTAMGKIRNVDEHLTPVKTKRKSK